jgi:hypothetical protein
VQTPDYFHANIPRRPSPAPEETIIHEWVLLYPT